MWLMRNRNIAVGYAVIVVCLAIASATVLRAQTPKRLALVGATPPVYFGASGGSKTIRVSRIGNCIGNRNDWRDLGGVFRPGAVPPACIAHFEHACFGCLTACI